MDSKTPEEEVESGLPPIYFCNIDVSYKKGKKKMTTHNMNIDVVSRFNTINGMHADKLTMDSIRDQVYGSTYKGQKHVMVRKIKSYKIVGHVNSNAL